MLCTASCNSVSDKVRFLNEGGCHLSKGKKTLKNKCNSQWLAIKESIQSKIIHAKHTHTRKFFFFSCKETNLCSAYCTFAVCVNEFQAVEWDSGGRKGFIVSTW